MDAARQVIIANRHMKLAINADGTVASLVHKPSGTECLAAGARVAVSSITEPRPYQNEVKLAYPCHQTTFHANAVRMEGDKLVIGYELVPWEAVVAVKLAEDYVAFTLETFRRTGPNVVSEPPVSEMWFLRLPVRERGHWGDWLNVVWDDEVAVNLLAADPAAKAGAEAGAGGCRILQAGADGQVRLADVTAALIVCATDKLLDAIAAVEEDYGLPHGVASRRHALYNASYYWTGNVHPGNVDEHIRCAQAGGFRLMSIYYTAFLESRGYRLIGNYDVFRKEYPNGKADLKAMLDRIRAAGITPGCHYLHSHIGRESRYVTPVPDHRLNLLRIFTLSRPLGAADTTIHVEQNPAASTMAQNRRVLKIGTELVSYEGYTVTPPYTFHGCVRGIDGTTPGACPAGFLFGLLDVSEFGATSVYLDQNSSLQDEVAEAIADHWDAGFAFFYFDGSEGVNPPFWHHVANAQYRVYRKLKPEPMLAEGAAKTHFSWHLLTGGNAFDIFRPERVKEETIRHPFREAPRMRDNFTRLNFGWLGYWLPDDKTVGTQPDQIEFVTSKAAAWDCPVSLHADPAILARHPRTPDNLEVFRRWEEVRARRWLTDAQKRRLRNPEQEFILLLDEEQAFELVPCERVAAAVGGSREVIAYTFRRRRSLYVVYHHIAADAQLELPMRPRELRVLERMGGESAPATGARDGTCVVPLGKRRFLKTSLTRRAELLESLAQARIAPL